MDIGSFFVQGIPAARCAMTNEIDALAVGYSSLGMWIFRIGGCHSTIGGIHQ